MDQERIRYLFSHPDWSEEDLRWMEEYMREHDKMDWYDMLHSLLEEDEASACLVDPEVSDRMRTLLLSRIRQKQESPINLYRGSRKFRWYVAAAVLCLLTAVSGSYRLLIRNDHPDEVTQKLKNDNNNDIAPGSNKAVLTLSNGTQVVLDRAHNGQLASQGNSQVVKVDSGLLAYKAGNTKQRAPNEVKYNTLTTPRGGQYRLVLPDGTKVWLNAASSIRYPTAFIGKDRMVEITGEAYFEVRHKDRLPFRVKAGKEIIEDIGTHFNVNGYTDESALRTTVAEGSVRIRDILLRHGEQASITPDGKVSINKDADVAKAIAWKDGYFSFGNSSLQAVMRQLCRWYDIQVIYEGDISGQKFGGEIPRNSNLSQVLEILKTSGVKFTIEGRKVKVTS